MSLGWEDFPVGREIVTRSVTVTEAHVVSFASLTGDWYALHTDAVAAAAGPFGERIAHGPLTFALAVGLTYQSQLYGDAVLAWLGADQLRAHAPVKFGDTVRVHAAVTESRPASKAGRGVVTLRYVVRNQADVEVMTCLFTVLMQSREVGPV